MNERSRQRIALWQSVVKDARASPMEFPHSPRLRELFERVVDLSPEERLASLRHENLSTAQGAALTAMLEADRRERGFFDTPAATWAETLDAELADGMTMLGQVIGPYRITGILGKGGSAVVFSASRSVGGGTQTVALKLLRHGMFSTEARRRFRREQAILVQLSHPNIARLIDGGISDAGIPYIAMEHVHGLDMLSYAQAHGLSRQERLRLFCQLCRAIDAAHRALIVHRDLKPTNVLVTADGAIKVLDFGIAKLADDDETATATQHISLTPGYAAPEQYARGSITTSADVYALGVLAGELLVGVRLGPEATWDDLHGNAKAALRQRWRSLDADVVAILRAALASDPARRYSSAGHFADDIGRYLRNEPIAVTAPSYWYRGRKFLDRHRSVVVASALLGVMTVVALALAVWQASVARHEVANTKAELARANAMRDFMFGAFEYAEPSVPRSAPVSVIDVAERAITSARNDKTASPKARVELLTRLAMVLVSQGELERAKELLEWTAANAAETLGDADPLTLEAVRVLAWNAILRGDYAIARFRINDLLARTTSASEQLRSRVLMDSATLSTHEHELARARREAHEAIRIARTVKDAELLREELGAFGNVLLALGEIPDAVAVYEELLNLERSRFGESHVSVAAAHADLSRAYRRAGALDRAEASARKALAVDRSIYADDNWHTANHLNALSTVLKERRDYEAALDTELEALRIDRVTLGPEHPDAAASLNNVGWYYLLLEDFENAASRLRESLSLTVRKFGAEHAESAIVRASYGYALAQGGKILEGEAEIEHAIASFAALAEPDADAMATAMEKSVRIALDREAYSLALRRIDRLAGLTTQIATGDAYWDGRIETLRGHALLGLRRAAESSRALDEARLELEHSPRPEPVLEIENALLRAAVAEALRQHGLSISLASRARRELDSLRHAPRRLARLAASLPS